METINGVTCIKGEIHSIMTIMRLNTRWAQSSKVSKNSIEEENPFVQLYRRLNEYLEGVYDLHEVDCVTYISPFHQVIVSDQGSGPLTSAALSSLSKFAMFGFLSADYPRAKEGIAMIANCISRCVFEETDWESDEIILMKLLELSTLAMRCNASKLLPIKDAWTIYSTCISIHGQYRASKILRSEAETALRHLTLTAFSRAHQALRAQDISDLHSHEIDNAFEEDRERTLEFATEIRGKSWEEVSTTFSFSATLGITLLLGKIMTVLSGLMDLQGKTLESVKFALSLINIALEAGGPALGSMGPLVEVLRGDVCRHLLKASQSEDLAVFSLALRVIFNLFLSIKDHMKIQLEVFLTSVHLRLLQNTQSASSSVQSTVALNSAKEELALESLLEFCREPALMNDLYINYDCDVQCTNLFERIITVLCAKSLPPAVISAALPRSDSGDMMSPGGSGSNTLTKTISLPNIVGAGVDAEIGARLTVVNRLALSGVMAVLHAVADRCCGATGNTNSLRERKVENASKSHENSSTRIFDDDFDSTLHTISNSNLVGDSDTRGMTGMTMQDNVGEEASSAAASALTSVRQSDVMGASTSANDLTKASCKNDTGRTFLSNESDGDTDHEVIEHHIDRWCEQGVDEHGVSTFLRGETRAAITPMKDDESVDGYDSSPDLFKRGVSTNPSSPMTPISVSAPPSSTTILGNDVNEGNNRGRSKRSSRADRVLSPERLQRADSILSTASLDSNEDAPGSSRQVPYGNGGSSTDISSHSGNGDGVEFVHRARARTAETLRQRKLKKQRLRQAAELFNAKPLKAEWIRFCLEQGLLQAAVPKLDVSGSDASDSNSKRGKQVEADPKSVAKFLKNTPGLGKVQVGEFISKGPADLYPFNAAVLREYLQTFDFRDPDAGFVKALRAFLGCFRLPGEAQCIDRLMEAFAGKLFQDLGPGKPFLSADAVFITAFSTIMLHTDLHNAQIPDGKKMTKEQFRRNNRGINDGQDIPTEYLENLYDEIKIREFQVDIDIGDSSISGAPDFSDPSTWNKLLHKSATFQAPAAFTPTLAARRGASGANHHGDSFLLAVHEKDMFQAMSQPVMDTLLIIMESTDDENIIIRAMEGIWNYATICSCLQLQSSLSSLIETLALRIQMLMDQARRTFPPATKRQQSQHSFIATLRRMEAESGRRHDLATLLSHSFTSTIQHRKASSMDGFDTPWSGVVLVRGELVLKVLFSLVATFTDSLEKESWSAVFSLLLWIRSRGGLPPELAVLDDIWYLQHERNPDSPLWGDDDSLRSRLALYPTAFASACHSAAKGKLSTYRQTKASVKSGQTNVMQSNTRKQSGSGLWGSVATLGGLLWNGGVNDDVYTHTVHSRPVAPSESPRVDGPVRIVYDANSSIYQPPAGLLAMDVKKIEAETTITADDFLALSVFHSNATIVFSRVKESDSAIARDALSALLETMTSALSFVMISPSNHVLQWGDDKGSGSKRESFSDMDGPNEAESLYQSCISELDLCTMLEWFGSAVLSSKVTAAMIWPKVHAFMKLVFDDGMDRTSERCPYFTERCILFILRASCELIEKDVPIHPSTRINLNARRRMQNNLQEPLEQNPSRMFDVWSSLRLLRNLPVELMTQLSGRVGAAMLHFMRISPGTDAIQSLEDWYLVFSLLSAATANEEGRAYVWLILQYLITSDQITDNNFSPCRHLILRYILGMFHGNENRERYSIITEGFGKWQLPAMFCLVRLTYMAIGGYIQDYEVESTDIHSFLAAPKASLRRIGSKSTNHTIPTSQAQQGPQIAGEDRVTFPLPGVAKIADGSKGTPLGNPGKESNKPSPANEKCDGGYSIDMDFIRRESITVTCLHFPRAEEIEVLWFETCKTLADFGVSLPLEISRRATYCLQAMLLAGTSTKFPAETWWRVLYEVVNRLPMNMVAGSKASNTGAVGAAASSMSAQTQSIGTVAVASNDPAIIADCCLRSCNVIFELLVSQIKYLRDTADFQSFWLRYMTILATNASVLPRGTPMHEEIIEMIAALMRLLRPPFEASVGVSPGGKAASTGRDAEGTVNEDNSTSAASSSWFFWSSAPAPVPVPVSAVAEASETSAHRATSDSNAKSVSAGLTVNTSKNLSTSPTPSRSAPVVDDAAALSLSWKSMCSLCPHLVVSLHRKHALLVNDINRYVDMYEARLVQRQQETQQAYSKSMNQQPRVRNDDQGNNPNPHTSVAKAGIGVGVGAGGGSTAHQSASVTTPLPKGNSTVTRSPPSQPLEASVNNATTPQAQKPPQSKAPSAKQSTTPNHISVRSLDSRTQIV